MQNTGNKHLGASRSVGVGGLLDVCVLRRQPLIRRADGRKSPTSMKVRVRSRVGTITRWRCCPADCTKIIRDGGWLTSELQRRPISNFQNNVLVNPDWPLPIGTANRRLERRKDHAPIMEHVDRCFIGDLAIAGFALFCSRIYLALVKTVLENTRCPGDRETGFRAIRPGEARRDTAAPGARRVGTLRPVWRAALAPMRFASTDSARRA
jgi:hypothetical protein